MQRQIKAVVQFEVGRFDFLVVAGDIDQQGHIVGQAFDLISGESPAFAATPVPPVADVSPSVDAAQHRDLPEQVRRQLERRLGFASELAP